MNIENSLSLMVLPYSVNGLTRRPVSASGNYPVMPTAVSTITSVRCGQRFTCLKSGVYPDEIGHVLYWAYMKTVHDVGGEPDAPGEVLVKRRRVMGAQHVCDM